ncbi:MAG: J domain-containing protein [Hyphomicrobiaceae bacterium]|nr:J domain-containing protein [Hyphomicrobiaceae bacterium]
MFERNKIDNTRHQQAIAVELTLGDGRASKGKLAVPMSKTLFDALNGDNSFIEFEPFDGEREFIAKSAVRSVRLINVPDHRPLGAFTDQAGFDPYLVLGLSRGASTDDLRRAYHRLSMTYHPDRYATAELPDEVKTYLEAMARRINTAYSVLQGEQAVAKRYAAQKSAPIYDSRRPA